jgi:hypothetical protein
MATESSDTRAQLYARVRYRETSELEALGRALSTSELERQVIGEILEKRSRPRRRHADSEGEHSSQWPGLTPIGIIGLPFLGIGAWILLFDPSVAGADVVNLQRLYIGQTSAIIGAIFVATGMRTP